MGLFDWFGRGRRNPSQPIVWHVYREGSDVVVEDGRGGVFRASVWGARAVRVVPNSSGAMHGGGPASGWQVTLSHSDGDALIGPALPDWQPARELAHKLCECTELPLDELTERMFSQVGRFSPKQDT